MLTFAISIPREYPHSYRHCYCYWRAHPPYHAHLLHPWPVAFAASVDPLFERHARNNAPKGRVGGKIAGKRLGLLRRVPVQDLGVGVWGRGFGVSGSGLSALASCVASLLRV
jgi:hypothetical protein